MEEVPKIRQAEREFAECTVEQLLENKTKVSKAVDTILENMK